jgi:putative transposase
MKATFGAINTTFSSYTCIGVSVAKSRRRVFAAREIDVPRSIFAEVCSGPQATRVEMDGDDDHVHLLAGGAPVSIVRQYIEQQKTQD